MARREVRQNPGLVDDVVIVGGLLLGGYLLIQHFKPDPGKGVSEAVQAGARAVGSGFDWFGSGLRQDADWLGLHTGYLDPNNDYGAVDKSNQDVGRW